ncbi:hypothetical protein EC988_004447 [Linderina pennispora]|nr:hypothetical protein EC988_004447 [Linderina pennispora]
MGIASKCPSYVDWASVPHPPFSPGPQRIPTMRPPEPCRTFSSAAIESVLQATVSQIKSPDMRQLLTNILPNTLDTAIAWHDPGNTTGMPYTFVITGDINAQWTRDSTNQFLPLLPYALQDTRLQTLVLGLINMQAEQISQYLFANAYKPPARSGLVPGENSWAKLDKVVPQFDPKLVFEAKFEIDSLAAFLKLSTAYWEQTKDQRFMSTVWRTAVANILELLQQLQMPTVDKNGKMNNPTVRFSRESTSPTETSFGHGQGNPVKFTGMVKSLFRPSDDSVIFPFFIPGNAMLSTELARLAQMLLSVKEMAVERAVADRLAEEIRQGIYQYGTMDHPVYGKIFVYETDGFGSAVVMDDANVPSLLSLPYLGFVDKNDPVYLNTRKLILSPDNPWYFAGSRVSGIGSPHTGFMRVWPMAIAMRALTTDDNNEVKWCLQQLLETTGGLGLMHESVDVEDPARYSRPWFAWCNGVASELIIDAVRRFPGIV